MMADKYMNNQGAKKRSGLKNRIKTLLKNRQGITLVELVVTFALMSLFATSTCLMAASSIKVYHQIRGINNALQVSDTLMDKIVGEFESAQVGSANSSLSDRSRTLKVAKDGTFVDLYDHTGSHIVITTTDNGGKIPGRTETADLQNQLLIYYYPVKTTRTDASGHETEETRFEGVDWRYDMSVYMGFKVKALTFTWVGHNSSEYPGNIFKIELVLTSDQYGDYKSERYVE